MLNFTFCVLFSYLGCVNKKVSKGTKTCIKLKIIKKIFRNTE